MTIKFDTTSPIALHLSETQGGFALFYELPTVLNAANDWGVVCDVTLDSDEDEELLLQFSPTNVKWTQPEMSE